MKTIKTMMKPLLALILLLAIAPCALPVRAEEVLPPLSDLFLYEADAGEENAEASRAANAAYREKIASLAQDSASAKLLLQAIRGSPFCDLKTILPLPDLFLPAPFELCAFLCASSSALHRRFFRSNSSSLLLSSDSAVPSSAACVRFGRATFHHSGEFVVIHLFALQRKFPPALPVRACDP